MARALTSTFALVALAAVGCNAKSRAREQPATVAPRVDAGAAENAALPVAGAASFVIDICENLELAVTSSADGGCDFELNHMFDVEKACTARAVLNGKDIPCNDPEGWVALDTQHIRLQGKACETYRSDAGSVVRLEIPCTGVSL